MCDLRVLGRVGGSWEGMGMGLGGQGVVRRECSGILRVSLEAHGTWRVCWERKGAKGVGLIRKRLLPREGDMRLRFG